MRDAMIKTHPVSSQYAKSQQQRQNYSVYLLVQFAGKMGNHVPNITGFA
jgi:hypothetical protein